MRPEELRERLKNWRLRNPLPKATWRSLDDLPPRAKVDIPFDDRFTSPIVDYRKCPDGRSREGEAMTLLKSWAPMILVSLIIAMGFMAASLDIIGMATP